VNRTHPADARAIERSLEIAGERQGDLAPRVYALLFGRQPEMAALFWRDKDNAIKGEMLAQVFETILDFIAERRYADHFLRAEVTTHEGYDVPREVFATFFGITEEAVRDACGAEWTDEMAQAWNRLLADLDQYVRQGK
jgi:hemoglobin-like flavoprotein